MPHTRNHLLARHGSSAMDRLRSHLSVAPSYRGRVPAESDQGIERVYFPHSGIISRVVEMKTGEGIETGMKTVNVCSSNGPDDRPEAALLDRY